MKRRSSTTWGAIFLAFLMFFSIHYTTIYVPVSWSFPSNSTTPHEEAMQLKSRRFLIPNKPNSTTGYPLAAAISEIITCDRSHHRYDVCSLNGPTLLDPTKSTLFLVDPTTSTLPHRKEKVRPYPRKWENSTMSHIKQLTLITSPAHTQCDYQHEAPALVFSTGGYTGNLFHDFNDGFVPLFVTVRSFFPNRAPVLVVANSHEWWLEKYAEVLRQFSPYPVVNLDTERSTHCFTSVTIGLISHDYMTIDPKLLPNSETFLTFRALLGNAYLHTTNHFPRVFTLRPRLVLVSRTGNVGRVITNQDEVRKAAEEIGFEVAMFEPNKYTPMSESYGLINTSHAMLGVHGAALTHSLFLRPGSVFIQVVPIGIDWLAETCFGKSSREMGLEYMEYKISVNESSLLDKYGKDDIVLRNPRAVVKQTFANTKKIYLQKQDVQLDLVRVQKYLIKAHKKAARFMNKEEATVTVDDGTMNTSAPQYGPISPPLSPVQQSSYAASPASLDATVPSLVPSSTPPTFTQMDSPIKVTQMTPDFLNKTTFVWVETSKDPYYKYVHNPSNSILGAKRLWNPTMVTEYDEVQSPNGNACSSPMGNSTFSGKKFRPSQSNAESPKQIGMAFPAGLVRNSHPNSARGTPLKVVSAQQTPPTSL